jgi:hypothetical protein
MTDQDVDDLAKQALAADAELARHEAMVCVLWADIRRLTRLGNAASTQYQRLVAVESELAHWKLLRERIRARLARAGE